MARRVARGSDRSAAPGWWPRLAGALGVGPRQGARSERRGGPEPRYAARTRSPRRRTAESQAHRDGNYRAYVAGFGVIVLILVVFLYVGLSWATTSTGRTAAMVPAAAAAPPPAPATAVPAAAPEPSPTAATMTTYVVKAGDTPLAIAQRYHVKVEDVLSANNISNPRALQVGQTLKIPPAPAR